MSVRRAKIVATLGPATDSPEVMRGLLEAGVNVARLNMSHGTHAEHLNRLELVRNAADETGLGIAVFADLQGPKIRVGTFANGPVQLENGATFTITAEDIVGDVNQVSTTYKGLPGDVVPGERILIDDGRLVLEVLSVEGPRVTTTVIEGGPISNNKGINLPGVAVSVPALSEKDIDDLRWALRHGVDMIALSFVRRAADILDVHRIMHEEDVRVPVIAKIEKPQAVDNLAAIVDAFDGIMVARGDLGVELPLEYVPMVQKHAINVARAAAKPVIVATQMLDSMITASRPTRAEASDVANAVLDGADALMLSGETSVGVNPIHVIEVMATIISHVENESLGTAPELPEVRSGSTARAVAIAAVNVGQSVGAAALAAFSETGRSARLVALHRPITPITAFTPDPRVRRQLALVWGVNAFLVDPVRHTDQMVDQVDAALLANNRSAIGDRVVIIAGSPPGVPGTTNSLRVHIVGAGTDARR
jgi:pyruvate kinase